MAVTAALWLSMRILMFQVEVSQSTIELQPWSLPEAKNRLPLLVIIANLQMLALWPRKFATFLPDVV